MVEGRVEAPGESVLPTRLRRGRGTIRPLGNRRRATGLPLLGREAELERLGLALSEARAGRGAIVLVSGEAGIGKTRLADEVSRTAIDLGVPVAWGRCWQGGGAPPYWPWAQLLRTMARGSVLPSELEPMISELATPHGTDPGAGPDATRFRMMRALLDHLVAQARPHGLCLVLDDLHDADASSLEALAFVARHIHGSRLLLLGTYREVEASLRPPEGSLLAAIARLGEPLALAPLGRGEVAELVRAAGLPARAIEPVHRASGGNPLFVGELVRLLRARGDVVERADDLPVPHGVREVIGQRLALLCAEERASLEIAAVLGEEHSSARVARLSGGRAASVESDLRRASELGIVARRGRGRWAFSHDLMREVLLRGLSQEARAELNARAARAALELGEERAGEIARHLLSAGLATEAAPHALAAARRFAEQLAFREGVELLDRTVRALEADEAPARTRCDALLALGELAPGAGEHALGRSACARAAELARALEDPAALARAALGYGLEVRPGLVDQALVALLREALDRQPAGERATRARLQARLASALQPAPDPSGPVRLAREAVELAADLDDRTRLEVAHAAMAALIDFVPAQDRVSLDREAAELATRLGDRLRAMRATLRLAADYAELGDVTRLAAHAEAYERLVSATEMPVHRWPLHAMRALLAALHGRFEEAGAETERVQALAAELTMSPAQLCAPFQRLASARLAERPADLARLLEAAVGPVEGLVPPSTVHAIRGSVHARAGDAEGCRRALGHLVAADAFADPRVLRDPMLVAYAAETAAAAGAAELAGAVLEVLEAEPPRWASGGSNVFVLDGPHARYAGLLHLAAGRREAAVRALRAARSQVAAAGVRALAARAALELAEALAASGERAEARQLFEEARSIARELGQEGLRPRIERALSGEREAPARAAPRTAGLHLSLERDGELWVLCSERGELRLEDRRWVRLLARLLAEPGRELHVLELSGAGPAEGDAGPLLDERARDAYRRRVEELEDALAEAESFGDAARATRAREELDALAEELARAVGLGGRERKAGSAAERARVAVTRRIRETVRRIAELDPVLGEHLELGVRTGTYCRYRPPRLG